MTVRKNEPPLSLELDFFEALTRFAETDPAEVEESVERAKQKKPPEEGPRRQAVSRASKSATRKR